MNLTAKLTLALLLVSGCSFYARGPDEYRKAVRGVLEEKNRQIESCYRRELERDKDAGGDVVVRFQVAPKTGELSKAKLVRRHTTAKEPVQRCVLDALEGLKLDPADQRTGEATFTWKFE